jgi:hypothetical protein
MRSKVKPDHEVEVKFLTSKIKRLLSEKKVDFFFTTFYFLAILFKQKIANAFVSHFFVYNFSNKPKCVTTS